MSLCDTCIEPGHCCKRLFLSGGEFSEPQSPEAAEHALMKRGLSMFRIGSEDPTTPGRYHYWCTALQPDGRCGVYENRPDLCRRYQPGSDPLCVHYWADPSDETHRDTMKVTGITGDFTYAEETVAP